MIRGGGFFKWDAVGSLMAEEDDITQAEFFRAFIKEIETWPSDFAKGMQLTGIRKLLTPRERELLSFLGDCGVEH